VEQKKGGAEIQLPKALEAISLCKNLPARISLPIETENREEKFVPATSSFEEHWRDLPDGRMRYLKAGSGRPLILIHGLMGYSFSWRFTLPALASHATLYAIDNLGAGFSTANDGMDCTVRATAKRVLQFADALGLEEFDLLGTSHGGGVAIMVAALSAESNLSQKHHPRKRRKKGGSLQRLVLVAPVNPWSAHGKRFAPFVGSAFGSMLFLNTFERWPSLHNFGLRRLFGDRSKIPSDSLEGYRLPLVKNHALRHGTRIVKNWTADLVELKTALPKIRDFPTLIMWGTKDGAVDFQSAELLRQNFRDVRLVTFEGVGHLPYEEAPDDFNRALIDFLTSTAAG